MKVSYGVTVCNETEEIKRLLTFLLKHRKEGDEIVILQDEFTTLDGVRETTTVINDLIRGVENIKYYCCPLNNDFSHFKNELNSHCTGDFIFQLDADEIPNLYLIENLHDLIENNPSVDLFYTPRINTVEGINKEHIQKWNWRLNEKGWVNFPDYQARIYRNSTRIHWERPVHELLIGYKQFSHLPQTEEFCLYHPKVIQKQIKQNEFYSTI